MTRVMYTRSLQEELQDTGVISVINLSFSMCYCKLKVACCSPATGDVRCGADHWRKGGRDGEMEREREVGVGGSLPRLVLWWQ